MPPVGDRQETARGQALALALVLTVVLVTSAALLFAVAGADVRRSDSGRLRLQLLNAARLGLAQARWATWDRAVAEGAVDRERVGPFLEGLGLPPGERRWLDGDRLVPTPPVAGALRLSGGPFGAALDRISVDVSVERRVERGLDLLLFAAEARAADGARRSAELVLRLGSPPYPGLSFALLARNASCIFCHTRIDDARRFHGGGAGSYPRVKVATLEALSLRSNCDSLLAGTLYVRGHLLSKTGVELPAPPGGSAGLQGETLDESDGTIVGRPLVDLTDGTPARIPFAGFYKHYPADPDQQFDGPLPDTFPPVVPDPDGNRQVNDGEWAARTAGLRGRVSGGVIVTVPAGRTWSGASLPSRGNASELPGGLPGTHAILVGTSSDPLRIEGDVAVDGDVVISGAVRGRGALLVRGSLYVVGDLTYEDGADAGGRTFGRASDDGENAVAYAAAGSILVGPYGTDKQGLPVTDEALTGFTGQQLALFNRMEWTKSQPWFDPVAGLPTERNTGVANSAWEPGHLPRYYVLDAAASPQMFLGGRWDNDRQAWVGKEKGDPDARIDLSGKTAGRDYVVHPLDPQGWISPDTLRRLQTAQESSRVPGPLQLDGLFYTSNAMFLMARSSTSCRGQVVLNGAIVAADAGLLVPGSGGVGLQLNYDARTSRLLRLEEPGGPVQPFALLRRER